VAAAGSRYDVGMRYTDGGGLIGPVGSGCGWRRRSSRQPSTRGRPRGGGTKTSAGPWPGSATWYGDGSGWTTAWPGWTCSCTGSGGACRSRPAGGRAGQGGGRRLEAGDVARHKRAAERQGAWLVFEDESGQGLRPQKGRTWGHRGRTPVVTVTGGHNSRVSLAEGRAAAPPGLPGPPRQARGQAQRVQDR
jgi:hypothetical protein